MALKLDQTQRSSSQPEELRLTLGEHLEELRSRIVRIALIITFGMGTGWFIFEKFFYNAVMQQVKSGLPKNFNYENVWTNLTEPFMFQLKMSFLIGLFITIPLTVMQLWGFIAPGLRPHERRPLQTVVPISIFLFFVGAFLGWWILPPTIGWFAAMAGTYPDMKVLQNPPDIVSFCTKMVLAFGIGFQLPLLVFFLARLGIITPQAITRYWRHATAGVFLATAIITPSGDPVSMMVMAIPLTVLTFGSIMAARLTMKNPDGESDVLNHLD